MKTSFILIVFGLLYCNGIHSFGEPVLIGMNYNDLLAIKEDLQNKKPEVVASYNRIINIANGILTKTPLKVTDGATPPSGNKNDFYTIAKYAWPNPNTPDGMPYYTRDGYINPESQTDTYDLNRYNTTIYYVTVLSMAWFYSDDMRYANKAAELLRVWFINQNTRMNPHFNHAAVVPGVHEGTKEGIIYGVALINMLDYVSILGLSGVWTETDNNAFKQWLSEYTTWLLTSNFGIQESNATNNHSTWYCAQVAAYSIYTGNINLADSIVEKGKFHVSQQIQPDGRLPRELSRTKSFHYALYGLKAFAALANCGVIAGNDLWNYETSDGRAIKKAFEFITPYIVKEQPWTWANIDTEEGDENNRINAILFMRDAASIYNTEQLKNAEDSITSYAATNNDKIWLSGRNRNNPPNLVYNGYMEIWNPEENLPDGYWRSHPNSSTGGFYLSTDTHTGNNALNVKYSGTGAYWVRTKLIENLEPGTYKINLWLKGKGVLRYITLSKSTTFSSTPTSENYLVKPFGGTSVGYIRDMTEWTPCTHVFEVESRYGGDYYIYLSINNTREDEGKPFLIDNISISREVQTSTPLPTMLSSNERTNNSSYYPEIKVYGNNIILTSDTSSMYRIFSIGGNLIEGGSFYGEKRIADLRAGVYIIFADEKVSKIVIF